MLRRSFIAALAALWLSPASGQTVSSNGVPNQTISQPGLTNFTSKLAALKLGSGSLRICAVGDSTTFGVGSNGSQTGNLPPLSYPTQLAGILTGSYGIKAQANSFMGDKGSYQTLANDARVTIGSSWSQYTTSVTIGGAFLTASTSTNALSFTPTSPVNTFRILYQSNPGNGVLQADIDGSGATTYNSGGTAALSVATISTGTVGTHTINLKWSSGGAVYVAGVEGYDSTQNMVSVVNAGWSASLSTSWNPTASPWSPSSGTAYQALGCDLTLINLGINDWSNATGVPTYTTNMQGLITAAKASGEVVLLTPVPTATSYATSAVQATYIAALQSLAASNNIPIIDNFTRWQSFAYASSLSLYQDTFTHPNATGYGEEAENIATALIPAAYYRNALGNAPTFDPLIINISPLGTASTGANGIALNLSSNSTTYTAITLNDTTGDSVNIFEAGGGLSARFFGVTDNTTGNNLFADAGGIFTLPSIGVYGFTSSSQYAISAADTAISRLSAGVLGVGTGAQGSVAGQLRASLYSEPEATVASAATIAPVNALVHISGTTAISTITSPFGTAAGCIDIIADGAWSTTTSGNIQSAMTASAGTQYRGCYSSSATKWFIK